LKRDLLVVARIVLEDELMAETRAIHVLGMLLEVNVKILVRIGV
jgi:hypothetical protein